jgi:acetyl-CoA carboxylase biotin carboxyl carrier protein
MYGNAPQIGEVLVGHSRAGRLSSLGRTVELVLPRGTSGRVAERALRNLQDPVEYGQVLLRLVPVEATEAVKETPNEAAAKTAGLPAGCFAVSSPTHGMFYRKARPDAPPYVEVGRIVDQGTTMALVEVMKCFSAITYGGEGLPPRGEVVEVRVEDASEVQADEILFVVKPVP